MAWSFAIHVAVFLGFASFRVAEHVAERPATVLATLDADVELAPDPVEPPPMVDLPDRPTEAIETDDPPPLEPNVAPDVEFPDVRSIISVTDRLSSTPRVVGRRRAARGSDSGVSGGVGAGEHDDTRTTSIAPQPAAVEPPPPPVERTPLRVVSAPAPTYPASASASHVEGIVMLEADVLEDGTVGEVRILESSGSKALDDAAIRAVRRWRFEPERLDGVALRSTVRLPAIKFRIER
ncbi:MAG: TonB family protein [Planctomycetes bacterium]|nr:TonB family protein [Planctomycetota bacterium]